jgi:hypothetical protein
MLPRRIGLHESVGRFHRRRYNFLFSACVSASAAAIRLPLKRAQNINYAALYGLTAIFPEHWRIRAIS